MSVPPLVMMIPALIVGTALVRLLLWRREAERREVALAVAREKR